MRFNAENMKLKWLPVSSKNRASDFRFIANLMYEDYGEKEVQDLFNDPKRLYEEELPFLLAERAYTNTDEAYRLRLLPCKRNSREAHLWKYYCAVNSMRKVLNTVAELKYKYYAH